MKHIQRVTIRHIRLPLIHPYRISYRAYDDFDPILVELRADDGTSGWGEAHIAGNTPETFEGAWSFCTEAGGLLTREPLPAARKRLLHDLPRSPAAATALLTAMDMLMHDPILDVSQVTRIPIVAAPHATDPDEVKKEIEDLLQAGYETIKIKVGKDVRQDLDWIATLQAAIRGRAQIRLDANCGYSREDALVFLRGLDPGGIELVEQPCDAADWEGNLLAARESPVPLMLDESIHTLADVERAAETGAIGYVKLKLKKFGTLELLKDALMRIVRLGMRPVLGNGAGTDLGCWQEACVARLTLDNAGEMNGFGKTRARIFETPLPFVRGAIEIPPGYAPVLNERVIDDHTERREQIG